MVDLKSQYEKIKTEVDNAIQDVINSTAFVKGKVVRDFEQNLADYLNVKHLIACANGTDALQIALMALGLKEGDEVITADFTFIATAEVIALLKLKPVLVDVNTDTFTISAEEIEKAITPNTKAIVPVHLFGQCADMDKIIALAKKHNIAIVEDTAQAIGADFRTKEGETKKAGTMGEFGCTSFFPSKNLGCFGDGGALYTNDDELADKARTIANHGMKIRYHHDIVGINSRLDGIQAAILKEKLKHLDEYNSARQKAANYYDNIFRENPKVEIPARNEKSTHVFHQYTLKLKQPEKRDQIIKNLKAKGIPAMIYYPIPLHQQKVFETYGFDTNKFEMTKKLCSSVISLPMHSELTEEQLEYITTNVLNEL